MDCYQCDSINHCQTCNNNLTLTPDATKCISCVSPNCLSCLIPDFCSLCQPGYLLQNSACVLCTIDNCARCSSDNTCARCSSGYSLNGNTCEFCKSPCFSCTTTGCSTCLPPFNIWPNVNGVCFTCNILNCAICTADGATCTTCKGGYDLSATNTTCVKTCPANCDTCDNSTVCTKCDQYFYLNANNICTQCLNTPKC